MKTTIIDGKTYEVCETKDKTQFLLKEISSKVKYNGEECIVLINGTSKQLIQKCIEMDYEPMWLGICYDIRYGYISYNNGGCVFGVKKK
jgi:hypothetical protein